MTVTTRSTLAANGVVLNTLAKNVESLTGRLSTPARRGENRTVSGRSGRIRSRKRFDQRTVVLPMWVQGCDDDGRIPSNSSEAAQLFRNVDELTRLFAADSVELVHTLPDNSARRIVGEVVDVIDFTATQGLAKFSVALVCPEPFWEDVNQTYQTVAGVGSFQLNYFAGSTAPIEDATVRFNGPCSNPKISTVVDGREVSVTIAALIGYGQWVQLDSKLWKLSRSSVIANGNTVDIDHVGDPRWLVLPTSASGGAGPTITVSETSGASTVGDMRTTINGRRKYMVG